MRTAEYRYTEWRDQQGKLVAKELYDHRREDEEGLLEKENVVDHPELEGTVELLGQKLKRVFED